jgi:hypothetical protein
MKTYKPILPTMTIKELEEQDPIAYGILMEVVRKSALCLYHSGPAPRNMGLEMCMEALLELIDTGYAKIIYVADEYDPDEDIMYVGFFHESTGEYKPPVYAIDKDDFGPEYDPEIDEHGNLIDDEGEEWKNG